MVTHFSDSLLKLHLFYGVRRQMLLLDRAGKKIPALIRYHYFTSLRLKSLFPDRKGKGVKIDE